MTSVRALELAHASHELRGAVAAAELCVSSLERARDSDDLGPWADDLRLQLERAAWAIDDLDRIRSAGGEVMADEPIEVGRLMRRRMRAWSRLARCSGKTVQLDWRVGAVSVRGDARRFCQALDNLISNAIRHGGDRVVVVGSLVNGLLRVEIVDGGSGPARLEPRAADPSDRHGHGLVIARHGVEGCGGAMRTVRGGVVLELPVAASLSAA